METKPVWTIMKILNWTKQYFADKGVENPRLDAEVLLCAVLKCERINLYVDFERPLSETELAQFKQYVVRRAKHEPLAYILGEKAFMRNMFKVTPDTLVPRPETELLVLEALKVINVNSNVLDLCTGSGAISIAVNKKTNCKVTAVDVSLDALTVAKENAILNGANVTFIESNMFDSLSENKFDVIISNPPYIESKVIDTLDDEVKNFEPKLALDGGVDGLDFYKIICENSKKYLNDNGYIFMECGIGQADKIAEIFSSIGNVEVIKDYSEIDRIIKVKLY